MKGDNVWEEEGWLERWESGGGGEGGEKRETGREKKERWWGLRARDRPGIPSKLAREGGKKTVRSYRRNSTVSLVLLKAQVCRGGGDLRTAGEERERREKVGSREGKRFSQETIWKTGVHGWLREANIGTSRGRDVFFARAVWRAHAFTQPSKQTTISNKSTVSYQHIYIIGWPTSSLQKKKSSRTCYRHPGMCNQPFAANALTFRCEEA